jgi:hypothetical protein
MTFSQLMQRAFDKIPKCKACGVFPCGCKEIEMKIAEQLRLKLPEPRPLPPETQWRQTRRERRTP